VERRTRATRLGPRGRGGIEGGARSAGDVVTKRGTGYQPVSDSAEHGLVARATECP
jgi:hypothetical protein